MNIRLTSQPLPSGFCALTDAQWQTLLALVSATATDTSGFLNVGTAPPEPDMRQYPWFRLGTDGSPDRVYYYWSGLWLSRHALAPGSVMLYTSGAGTVSTFDGGEASPTTATPTSGPMWEEVTAMQARFPLGAGTLPSGTVVAPAGTGGAETHTLTKGEMPVHAHYLLGDHTNVEMFQYKAGSHEIAPGERNWLATPTDQTQEAGNSAAHNNMPPYYGVIFIKRTARLFYRV